MTTKWSTLPRPWPWPCPRPDAIAGGASSAAPISPASNARLVNRAISPSPGSPPGEDATPLPLEVVGPLTMPEAFDPTPPPPAAPDAPRRWWGRHGAELRWQAELGRLMIDPVFAGRGGARRRGVPRGDGGPVMLIPGFLAGDTSLSVMAGWLDRMGHRPHRSGIACNVGCSDRAPDALEGRAERIAGDAGRPLALIGHSRGGHFAKALGHRRPDLVSRVITMGSGLDTAFDISIPTRAAVAAVRWVHVQTTDRVAKNGCFTDTCRCRFTHDFAGEFPASVPLVSIYSRGDGVVWWEACTVPYARNVEVTGSHIGLAYNRKAYRVIGDALVP